MPATKTEAEKSAKRASAVPAAKRPFGSNKQPKAQARKINALQKKRALVLPKAPLARTVREIARSVDPKARMKPEAFKIIQRVSEAYALRVCSVVKQFAEHANRNTVQFRDFVLWQLVCAEANIPLPDFKEMAIAMVVTAAANEADARTAAAAADAVPDSPSPDVTLTV